MILVWDSIEQLKANDEFVTMLIELATFLTSLLIVFILIYLKRKYPKLTKKGFIELQLGFIVYSSHFLFDMLDTLVKKKINNQTTLIYTIFDMLDAILSTIGLLLIGLAFYRIAQYGMELWEEKKK